jgi:hypothetical protein
MRIRWKALLPVVGILGAWLASPEALKLVPDKWSHVVLALSSLIAVLMPALLTDKPPTQRPARRSVQRESTHPSQPPIQQPTLQIPASDIPPAGGFDASEADR